MANSNQINASIGLVPSRNSLCLETFMTEYLRDYIFECTRMKGS